MDAWLVAPALVVALYAVVVLAFAVAGRTAHAREVALFIPNLVLLFRGLLGDARVSRRAKVAVALTLVYLAIPIDLIPDFIPVAGALDDAVLAAAALRLVLASTPREVLFQHWRGDGATLARLLALFRA